MNMRKNYRANRIGRSGTFLILISMIGLLLLLSGCGSSGELTWSASGTVTSGGVPLSGVTVTLTGPSSAVFVTDANGNYGFSGLSQGTYVLTPTLAGYAFVPPNRPAYLYGDDAEGFNFSAVRGISVSTTTHTLYRNGDGTVRAWGRNNKGQLGDGTTTDSATHLTVVGLTNVTSVAAGNEHSLALKSDGTVRAWGSNSSGQLGNGTTTDSSTPVPVSGLTNVTAIAAGFDFSLALKSDGTVWGWGFNGSGQLGNATTANSSTPVQVNPVIGVATAIAAGFNHSVAITNLGIVWMWGSNSKGQLGNATTTDSSIPIPGSNNALAVSAGNQFTVALFNNNLSTALYAWGSNSTGQLGNGTNIDTLVPLQVSLLGAIAVSSGSDHSVALRSDGTIWTWGGNSNGQLGDGTTTARWAPVQVGALSGGQGVTAGYQDSFASKTVGTVFAWGDNAFGQLGDGSTTDRLTPVAITLP
jgi:alpha-tubulin suppressor-like RCC1 family protein